MTASSKKISLNSLLPAMLGIGRTVIPGVRMSTRNIEMPTCFFTSVFGAREQQAVVGGRVGVAVPDLLAVHDVVVAVAHRARLEGREVGTGLGLGEPLAPQHVAGGHARQVARLLLRGAEAHDQRTDVVEVHVLRTTRFPRRPHLFAHDGLLPHRSVGAAVFGRPAQREPAARRELCGRTRG